MYLRDIKKEGKCWNLSLTRHSENNNFMREIAFNKPVVFEVIRDVYFQKVFNMVPNKRFKKTRTHEG